jgi:hypothetical protein
MSITKLYFTPQEIAEEINEKYKEKVDSNDIRLHCRYPEHHGEELDHIKKGNRYFITRKGREEALKYYSPEEQERREKEAMRKFEIYMKLNK